MEELKIYQKSYDCLLRLYQTTKHFPKSEKFTLAAELKTAMLGFLRLIFKAGKSANKKSILYTADVELEIIRMQIRAAKDMKIMSVHKYEILARDLSEIGKMLGGWIKMLK